jgi:hypothetical protein
MPAKWGPGQRAADRFDVGFSKGGMMSRRLLGVLGCAALAICAYDVRADSISYSDFVAVQRTNWNKTVSVSQFNPSLGTLDSVLISLQGTVAGSAKFESRDHGPTTVTMSLQAQVTLSWPNQNNLVVALPLVQTVDNVTVFDGTTDFGGSSGRTYDNLSGSKTESALLSPPTPTDLAVFLGTGTVTLPVKAEAQSFGTGAGNLIQWFMTDAGADVTVTYDYRVPEPAAGALIGLGGLALIRRRR